MNSFSLAILALAFALPAFNPATTGEVSEFKAVPGLEGPGNPPSEVLTVEWASDRQATEGTVASHFMTGKASFYDYTLDSGWSSKGHLVCAMRHSLDGDDNPFKRYSTVKVTHGDKSTTCKICDFGPEFALFPDRIIDLSSHAFSQLADPKLGVIDVEVEILYDE